MKWAVGVTTVPKRRGDLLPRTLASLVRGGFERPWVFVDGCDDLQGWRREFDGRCAGVTCRYPAVRAFAAWMLALAELYARDPLAGRFLMVQDDCLTVRNLRSYLETVSYPDKSYWNLITFPPNWRPDARKRSNYTPRVAAEPGYRGFYPADQTGQGAVALVFDNTTVRNVLTSRYLVERPLNLTTWTLNPRGFRVIDGGLVDALKLQGYTEMVHSPSLFEHVGEETTIDRRNTTVVDPNFPRFQWPKSKTETTFPGEDWDAMELVKT